MFPARATKPPVPTLPCLPMTTLLFFDDNLLAVRHNVRRGVGRPKLIPESVFHGDKRINLAWAYPGIFYDDNAGKYRMAYQGKTVKKMMGDTWVKLLAESKDGITWRETDTTKHGKVAKRKFKHQVGDTGEWCGDYVDPTAPDEHRFKRAGVKNIWSSPDGLRWNKLVEWQPVNKVDMSAFPFWSDVYKKHFIIARRSMGDRRICIYETDDWQNFSDPTLVIASDGADAICTDVYGMNPVPYEGWYVGLFWLYHGAQQFLGSSPYKYTGGKVDCQLSYSLNGFTWQRAQRDAFIPHGDPGDVDAACVYASSVIDRKDLGELWIYASVSTWEHGPVPQGAGAIATYRLRRDGFTYLESEAGLGTVTTKPLYWRGGELHLNLHVGGAGNKAAARYAVGPPSEVYPGGYLMNGARVQINDYRGNPMKGYTFEDCRPFAGDSQDWKPTWKSGKKLAALKGKDLQVSIQMNNARLYAIRGNFQLMSPQHWRDYNAKGEVPQVTPGLDLPV